MQIRHVVKIKHSDKIIYCVALHIVCQVIQLNGKFFSSIWKNLHRAEKIYTGTACGACDKYEAWKEKQLDISTSR